MRAQLHHRSFFTLYFNEKREADHWSGLVKLVGEWLFDELRDRNTDLSGIIRAWLFTGGEWFSNQPDVRIMTRVFRGGQAENEPPLFWSLRFERRDPIVSGRSWRTDLGMNYRPNEDRVDLVLSHSFSDPQGQVHKKLPPAQVPELAFRFFDRPEWRVAINAESIVDFPKELLSGQEEGFLRLLKAPARQLPIVLVNLMALPDTLDFRINDFSDLLVMNAHVFFYQNNIVESKLRHLLGAYYGYYRCHDGIRVFFPNLDMEAAEDHTRHRYFLWQNFESVGELELAVFLQFLKPRKWPFLNFVATLEDVTHRERLQRMDSMRFELAKSEEARAFFQMMDDENNDLREKNELLKAQFEQKSMEAEALAIDVAEAARTLSRMQFELTEQARMLRVAEFSERSAAFQSTIFQQLEHLPKRLPDAVRLIENLFPDRLLFLPSAHESAATADWEDLQAAWTVLFQMGNFLWPLHFERNADTATMAHDFKEKTGQELAYTDNKHTKADNQSQRDRLFEYLGQFREFNPRIKINKGGRFLRIHFIADQSAKKLVIGHCGNHLTTAGTRRAK